MVVPQIRPHFLAITSLHFTIKYHDSTQYATESVKTTNMKINK